VKVRPAKYGHLSVMLTQTSDTTEGRSIVTYEVNEQGQSYGALTDSRAPGDEPDLIEAFGDDHKTVGYVRRSDLERRAQPVSPEEVAAHVASKADGRVGDVQVPLLAKDGVTVLGTYTVKGWSVSNGEQFPPVN
jgi:hypothetical protein